MVDGSWSDGRWVLWFEGGESGSGDLGMRSPCGCALEGKKGEEQEAPQGASLGSCWSHGGGGCKRGASAVGVGSCIGGIEVVRVGGDGLACSVHERDTRSTIFSS